MSLPHNWRKIDDVNRPSFLRPEDYCLYFMDYKAGADHTHSEANQRIKNFKKDPKYKGQYPWRFKLDAVLKFASDLERLFITSTSTGTLTICFIPGSKHKHDANYDERFDLLKKALERKNLKIIFEEPITVRKSRAAAHCQSNRPSVLELKESYEWKGFNHPPEYVCIIDDVITSGSQFIAFKETIFEKYGSIGISGIFWAKTYRDEIDLL